MTANRRSRARDEKLLPDSFLAGLGFRYWMDVASTGSVGDRFPPGSRRGGIYLLRFADGEYYLGKAVDVVRRLGQHQRTYSDIVALTFRLVPTRQQAEVERQCIHALEAHGLPLRNIAEMSTVRGVRVLDALVPVSDQDRWLVDAGTLADTSTGVEDPDLRRRQRRRFEEFGRLPEAKDAIDLLGLYLRVAIPAPRRTEREFWSMTCLPSSGAHGVLSRMNLNMQEVFTLIATEEGLDASFHLARSPFIDAFGQRWMSRLEARGVFPFLHQYKPGGQDQFQLCAGDPDKIRAVMRWDVAQRAMRVLNLNLMRKGPNYYPGNHCPDLADAALASTAPLVLSSTRRRRPEPRVR